MGVRGKWFYDLFKSVGAGGSKEWFIHKQISSASKNIKIEWLKAFFDDEAHVSKTKKRIVLNIVNKKGLIQIQKLLDDLNIESRIHGPYKYKQYKSYHLKIYGNSIRRYFSRIGFNEPNKQKDLSELVTLI
ncbi:LAGLIDADG family homing endonuclease [Candidatus Woesearchaeota archaeon]|nr:LAGLIDADG family homing endonuclease [Candidatus Woesearchaeota archaeon]